MTDIHTCWTLADLAAELDRYEAELRSSEKTQATIQTYLQHPQRFLRWLEGSYSATG
jgi:hypothetical protein